MCACVFVNSCVCVWMSLGLMCFWWFQSICSHRLSLGAWVLASLLLLCLAAKPRERETLRVISVFVPGSGDRERESTHCSCDCGLHMGICGRHLASDKHILHCLTQLWSVLWNASWNHSYNEAESWFRIHTFAETMPWLLTTGIVVDLSKFWRLCKPRSWDLFYA